MELWDEIIQKYNQELETIVRSVAGGSADDFPTYKHMVGYCAGIEWSREALKDIFKKRMHSDNEDD
jgi:hypothetical protein|tara:strand:+ start:313 stop:510 length:198 start_codon:yes stop_codon:yes gene_type:complete